MFDSTESAAESSRFSALLCALQFFVVPFACLIFGVITATLLEGLLRITTNRIAELILGYVVFCLVGFAFGYSTQTAIPRLLGSGGRWVWIPPVGFLAYAVLNQFRRNPNDIAGFFVLGDEGLVIVLLTWPAVATCFYSVGCVVAHRAATTAAGAAFRKAILQSPITKLARMF